MNDSKTFIIGIIIFVVLVIGGFAFFAKKEPRPPQSPSVTQDSRGECILWKN